MIDKLDLRVPRELPIRGDFLVKHKRRWAPKTSSYKTVLDAPELSLRIFERCTHYPSSSPRQHYKISFNNVYQLSARDVMRAIKSVFEIDDEDVRDLQVMRVDLTVDVRNVPVKYFFESIHVKYKQAATSYGIWQQLTVLLRIDCRQHRQQSIVALLRCHRFGPRIKSCCVEVRRRRGTV